MAPSDPPPRPPTEPDAAECCGSGCAHCVFDAYEVALENYRSALASWQARQPLCAGVVESATATLAGDPKPKRES